MLIAALTVTMAIAFLANSFSFLRYHQAGGTDANAPQSNLLEVFINAIFTITLIALIFQDWELYRKAYLATAFVIGLSPLFISRLQPFAHHGLIRFGLPTLTLAAIAFCWFAFHSQGVST